MDTEEAREIVHLQRKGLPETDEGPFYHDSWWEAYKGGVKGIFGGLIVGGGVGALVGLAAAAGLAAAGIVTGGAFGLVVLGFSGLGAALGAHEFANIGIVTGAVAASHEMAEERTKEFENARYAELKREIRGLRAAVTGGKDTPEIKAAMAGCEPHIEPYKQVEDRLEGYRTMHCDDQHCEERKLVFPKIALIGALAGTAAGALLGSTGMLNELMEPLKHAGIDLSHGASLTTASAIVGGSLGASFGINRDLFRSVFDTTDRLFKGVIVPNGNGKKHAHGMAHDQNISASRAAEPEQELRVVMEPPVQETQKSSTFFRDSESMRRILLKLDHTVTPGH